jgi:3-oxoacyl-[acyl-carrier-protein] synthase II
LIVNRATIITGIGAVGGFGCGVKALHEALGPQQPIGAAPRYDDDKDNQGWPGYFADTERLLDYVNKRHLRRIDHFTRLAVLGGFLALDDAGMLNGRRSSLGIIVATGNGATANQFDGIRALTDDNEIFGSPTKFAASVHNAAAATLAILLKTKGPNLTVSQFDQSVGQALLTAWHWIRQGRVEAVLVGGVDEYNYAAGRHWRQHFEIVNGLNDKSHYMLPAMVGEGAVFVVACSEQAAGVAPKRYALIDDVCLGARPPAVETISFDLDRPMVLGADGYSPRQKEYARLLPAKFKGAVYSGLFGALPVGQGFDAAIAALSLRAKRLFPSIAPYPAFMDPMVLHTDDANVTTNGIDVLKLTVADAYSLIRLSPMGRLKT